MKATARLGVVAVIVLMALLAVTGWIWFGFGLEEVVEPPTSPSPTPDQIDPAAQTNAPPPTQPLALTRREPTREEIVGIGAVLRKDPATDELLIVKALPGSPAATAGLDGEFIIRKIDDTLADGLPLRQCVDLLRGAVDTKVRLEVFDPAANETRAVELTRRKIEVGAPPIVPER